MTVNLSDRMKKYEAVTKTNLTCRMPVVIRLDGKAFHSFTRGFDAPFDVVFRKTMCDVMQYLCEHVENCVMGYTQSDEITLVLCDYATTDTQAWFDNEVLKICSISASMATMAFNKFFADNVTASVIAGNLGEVWESARKYIKQREKEPCYYDKAGNLKMGMFDSRCFNVPREDVPNAVLWRQQDATRNSIQGLAQQYYSKKQLEGVSNKELLGKLINDFGIYWEDYPTWYKRGVCCVKKPVEKTKPDGEKFIRNSWVLDFNIPIFTKDWDYIASRVNLN